MRGRRAGGAGTARRARDLAALLLAAPAHPTAPIGCGAAVAVRHGPVPPAATAPRSLPETQRVLPRPPAAVPSTLLRTPRCYPPLFCVSLSPRWGAAPPSPLPAGVLPTLSRFVLPPLGCCPFPLRTVGLLPHSPFIQWGYPPIPPVPWGAAPPSQFPFPPRTAVSFHNPAAPPLVSFLPRTGMLPAPHSCPLHPPP